MRTLLGVATAAVLVMTTPLAAGAAGPASYSWKPVDVGTSQQLRGLDAVDRHTAWVGGSDGGVWRTTDGGSTWQDVSPPDAAGLLFRDVEATDAWHAQVLAIGSGDASRIYKTTDGGQHWRQTFVNDDPAAFYDCFAFWPGGRRGIAMSDPVDGRFRILRTDDAGSSWHLVDPAGMPPAIADEAGFAASGTCLVTAGGTDAFLGSGGGAARIFHSHDRGRTWTVTDSTLPSDPVNGAGVFSLAFRNPQQGIAVGGILGSPDDGADFSATTRDRGRSWTDTGDLGGYRSGVAWVSGTRATAIAVGPTGSDVTTDGGRTWTTFNDVQYDAVQSTPDGAVWASGPEGRVAQLRR
jgi:photosystem II stability/assembly factor-like uncharacterized protein